MWRAFRDLDPRTLTYVDVGANEPRHLSITASLYDSGWRGLLIEADPDLAEDLRIHRPGDTVVQMAAAATAGTLTFHRVPGTGLGTLDPREAEAARSRGFAVEDVTVATDSLDSILAAHHVSTVHFMSVDVEGAEADVLAGLGLQSVRPWVLCVEAVLPGTTTASHEVWEPRILTSGYSLAAFDGVNRWYVADEHADLVAAVAVPFNAIDAGADGWITSDAAAVRGRADRANIRRAWQRELILNDIRGEVAVEEYEKQIHELRTALVQVEGSRTWRYARKAGRPVKALVHRARMALQHLPGPVQRRVIQHRHLKHVTVNMGHLTPAPFLGPVPTASVDWISPEDLPPAPTIGLDLTSFTAQDAGAVRTWLEDPHDGDALLERRVDNHDDELGRTRAALRLRLALAEPPQTALDARGGRVLVDARALQTAAFGRRGIGRFARAALIAAREELGDDRVVLLVDRGLEELPGELAGTCRQIERVREHDVAAFSALLQLSPMTASSAPLVPLLHSAARKIAVVFDFIPLHHPQVYLANVAARAEYAAALDALMLYDEYVCISDLTRRQVLEFASKHGSHAVASVAWPRDTMPGGAIRDAGRADGPIVLMTGDDARKNTFGGLAGIAAATAGEPTRDVVVIGMAGTGDRVHHWSIAAAMRPGEARLAEHLSEEEMTDLLAHASVVVVPSFDEGLSLPVIEALRAGAPVVASDIPAHRELLGSGSFLADPASPKDLARAVRSTRGSASARSRQLGHLAGHRHEALDEAVTRPLAGLADLSTPLAWPVRPSALGSPRLSVGVAAPWPPQRTGVADFTAATVIELARLADVTVYTTADADIAGGLPADVTIEQRRVDELMAGGHDHDVLVSVVGNSHFHLPFIQLVQQHDCVVITHDTRLVELYLALRDRGGLQQVMLRGKDRRVLTPPLDDQIEDMRLLQSTAFWEVARRSQLLIGHTPTAAEFMHADTGVPLTLLPFANYRRPQDDVITDEMRRAARTHLGFDDGLVHLASFGFIDTRTKQSDVVVEAAAWLSQWGRRVSLHLVGSAPESLREELTARAAEAGIEEFEITGFVDDDRFRDYVLGIDLGIQLRVSPLLGVSGPLSDMAAYGTPAVANRGICTDVDTPDFIDRLPDDVSPVIVAEAVDRRLDNPWDPSAVERMRVEYLAAKDPSRYAAQLLELLETVAQRGEA